MIKKYLSLAGSREYITDINSRPNYTIWLVCSLFVFLQFFLQLSSGIVIGTLMYEMQFSALTAGILSSSFYIIYTILQIPVGILADKYNSRILLMASSMTCAIGCLLFSLSVSLSGLFFSRALIGIGSSFAFVTMAHIVRSQYPIKYFSTLIGTSETLGFFATVIGIIGMGQFISNIGWRSFMQIAFALAAILSYVFWLKIPNSKNSETKQINYIYSLKMIISNKLLWLNGLFVGLCFATITVFGALWAAPFLQLKLKCHMNQVSVINSLLFLGAGFGCPLFGILSSTLKKRKPLIIFSCLVSALLFTILIYMPTHSLILNGIIIFFLGLCCCSYILAYAISNELSPANSLSTCTGFTNTLALCTAPLLQPLVGSILDNLSADKVYTLYEYQKTLTILPICLLIAGICVVFLPENRLISQNN